MAWSQILQDADSCMWGPENLGLMTEKPCYITM